MSCDMTTDVFAQQTYGQIALQKMQPLPENFRLFKAGWLGDGTAREVMKVTGGEYRVAKSGKNKGLLSVLFKGTEKYCFVTWDEMANFSPRGLDKHQDMPGGDKWQERRNIKRS